MQQGDRGAEADGDEGHYFFLFSAPASPVHYILRSPPSSTAGPAAAAAPDDGDRCAGHGAAGDFEFFAARGGGMSSAEDLFVAGRIRVGGGLSPIRQEDSGPEDRDSGDEDEDEEGRDGGRARRRARSASPPRSPRAATAAEPSSHPFASGSSSSSSSSSSAKSTRRRISLRDLLTGTGGGGDSDSGQAGADAAGINSSGFWPSRSRKAVLPCPAPLPGRRSTSSSDRAAAAPAKKLPPGGGARRTTPLPYRQGLVLGCLGFGPRSCGLAKSMHPLYSR
jgi:hypothetical protein